MNMYNDYYTDKNRDTFRDTDIERDTDMDERAQ
jgi:hypothetical protein